MQYGHKFAAVESEGLGETKGFSIAASGKAFRSLIDSIYSRKIEAPIRELATNAFDGHLAVGRIDPFDVHLPTIFDPTFWVRDYGCSMSHWMVMNRYTTLFDSTKDGQHEDDAVVVAPNNQVGSWGLGSKTPFTYTDAFTLTCWMDGRVRIYSIFIGDNGQPQCALAFEGPSDEPTGVKVEFPANPGDIEEFADAAVRVFKGFNILPNGLPTTVLSELQVEPLQIGAFWKAYPSSYLGSGFFARQGCVIYPIDLDKADERYSKFGQVRLSVVLDFPIGSIEYTNSREFLAYTPETVASINTALEAFRVEIEHEAQALLDGFKNRFARASAVGDTSLFALNRFSFLTEARADRDLITKAFDQLLCYSPRDYRRPGESNPALYAVDSFGEKARYRQHTFAGGQFPERVAMVLIDEKTRVGTAKIAGVSERVAKWLSDNGMNYAYVFKKLPSLSLLRQCGFPPITRLSIIPKLPKAVRDPASFAGSGFARYKQGETEIDEEELPDNALFVLINRGRWLNLDGSVMTHADRLVFGTILAFLARPIIAINTRSNEKLDRWHDHDLIYSYTLDEVVSAMTDQQIKGLIAELNYRRFKVTTLDHVVQELRKKGVLKRTPLAPLDRFRLQRDQARYKMSEFIDLCDDIFTSEDNPHLNEIVERGRAMGLEVLCPPVGEYYDRKPYETHLLPKEAATFTVLVYRNNLNAAELDYLVKEIFE